MASTFGFNLLMLAVPTTLMGVSLPLLARGVVSTVNEAAHRLGRLYAINTDLFPRDEYFLNDN